MTIETIELDDGSGEVEVDTEARMYFDGEPEPYVTWRIPFSHAETVADALESIDRAREVLASFGDAAFPYHAADVHGLVAGLEALERAGVIYVHPLGHRALVRTCRACGCTDVQACDPPCSWAEPNLCTRCVA